MCRFGMGNTGTPALHVCIPSHPSLEDRLIKLPLREACFLESHGEMAIYAFRV